MSSKGPIPLDESYVKALQDKIYYLAPSHSTDQTPMPPHQMVYTTNPGRVDFNLVVQVEADTRQTHIDHAWLQFTQGEQLDQAIEASTGSLSGLSETESTERQITAVEQVTASYQAQLKQARQQANSFFGSTPISRSVNDFVSVARQQNNAAKSRQAWLASYRAAFETIRLEKKIAELHQRRADLTPKLESARLKSQQREQVNRQIQRIEQSLARFFTSTQELQRLSSSLQGVLNALQQHHQDGITPKTAAEHAHTLEQQTSDLIQSKARLRQHAAQAQQDAQALEHEIKDVDFTLGLEQPQAPYERREELLQLKVQMIHESGTWPAQDTTTTQLDTMAQQAIDTAFDEQVHLAMLNGSTPSNTPVTFEAWTSSTRHALVLASSRGAVAHFEPAWAAFGEALQRLATHVLAQGVAAAARYAPLMLYSTRLGNGERMGVSVPLAWLAPGADQTLDANRLAGQTLELPLRMNAVPSGTETVVYLAATDGSSVQRDVRVRQAEWDNGLGAYRFTAEGPGGAILLWHPATPPSTLSSYDPETGSHIPGLPIVEDLRKHTDGLIQVPPELDIRTFPALPDEQPDDYVIVFPVDAGLAPIYVMFRDPRQIAGVASGHGQVTPDRFLEAAVTPEGAPIPARIADKLRGRRFSSFDRLREAFWREVGADPEFRQHFTLSNQQRVEEGSAPHVPAAERAGKRGTFELHHIAEVARGGAVYDMDNITIMTPHQHIAHHSKRSEE